MNKIVTIFNESTYHKLNSETTQEAFGRNNILDLEKVNYTY